MGRYLARPRQIASHEPDQRVRLEREPAVAHVLVEDAGDGRGAEQLEHPDHVARIVVERIEDVRHADIDAILALRLMRQPRAVVADIVIDVAQHLVPVAAAQLDRDGRQELIEGDVVLEQAGHLRFNPVPDLHHVVLQHLVESAASLGSSQSSTTQCIAGGTSRLSAGLRRPIAQRVELDCYRVRNAYYTTIN